MAIYNMNEQIEKVLAEIDRTYSKGMEFKLEDLSTVNACKNESNYKTFLNMLSGRIAKVAFITKRTGNVAIYRKK